MLNNNIKRAIAYSLILNLGITTKLLDTDAIGECICLNEKGNFLKNIISTANGSFNENSIKYSLFCILYSDDFLIDFDNTDFDKLGLLIDNSLKNKQLILPWIYDNLLYNKYYDECYIPGDTMTYNDTLKLLNDTPQGTYQIYDLIFGSFGIMTSETMRNVTPLQGYPLWHCSNPGCFLLHKVKFGKDTNSTVEKIVNLLKENEINQTLDIKNYYKYYIVKNEEQYDEFYLGHLPQVLGYCFDSNELKILLEHLIIEHQNEIRIKLPSKLKGSAKDIASKLSKNECLQIILLLNNTKIVSTLEKLIDSDLIYFPPTEIRNLPFTHNSSSNLVDIYLQCSKYGLRTTAAGGEISLFRLKNLIQELYPDESELNWLLRDISVEGCPNIEIGGKLIQYINTEDIYIIIAKLITCRKDKINEAISFLKFGNFDYTDTREGENYIIEKIIWKLGFNNNKPPQELKLFWDRYRKFYSACKKHSTYTEEEKDSIRSQSINFFIDLESLLQKSLAYSTWALVSDHYSDTNFEFHYDDAKEVTFKLLNGYKLNEEVAFTLDPSGEDTLYPLIQGFDILAQLCESLLNEKDSHIKPNVELPSGYNQNVVYFPFLHDMLLFDLPKDSFDKVINELRFINKQLIKINVCSIRNSTSHQRKREKFPTSDELIDFCQEIKPLIERIEKQGLYPLVYSLDKITIDKYNRKLVEMKDYKEATLSFYLSNDGSMYDTPQYDSPHIISPFIKLSPSDPGIRFYIQEKSNYTIMNENYPKRRSDQ